MKILCDFTRLNSLFSCAMKMGNINYEKYLQRPNFRMWCFVQKHIFQNYPISQFKKKKIKQKKFLNNTQSLKNIQNCVNNI